MINQYETIIWDWNGTLLNDVDICVSIVNTLLEQQNGTPITKSSYQQTFGFPIVDYYRKIGIDFSKESFEELTKKFMGSYTQQVKNCALHDSTLQVLTALRQKGKEQYILTAAHKESVLKLLDFYNLRHYFKQIEGLDNFRAESKVQRGIHLIEDNNINRASTVLIGDTIHDFDVAQELGVQCILVADGHQSKIRLESNSSDNTIVISDLSQLINP